MMNLGGGKAQRRFEELPESLWTDCGVFSQP